MRRVERRGDLAADPQRALGVDAPDAVEQAGEVAPADVAHRQEQHAVALADAVDRHDVRVLERGRHARLAQEALAEALVARELGGITFTATRRLSATSSAE